ncbi:MAG: ABC transporter substrate-binding protein [Pseudomonas sp.]
MDNRNTFRFLAAVAVVLGGFWQGVAMAGEPLRIGMLLPQTGAYAALGQSISNGVSLAIDQHAGRFGGRPVELVEVDGSSADETLRNMRRLIRNERVDAVIGPVHSDVGIMAVRAMRNSTVPLIIPNAGFNAATGQMCAPNVFRTSFSSWQNAWPLGQVAAERGYRNVVTLAWRYGFGVESVAGFKEGLQHAGGRVSKEIYIPFPELDFDAALAEITALEPDAVFVFFAGSGAPSFLRDYAAAGLHGRIPLIGPGFVTEGALADSGAAAEGVLTTLHYADSLDTPRNRSFRGAYQQKFASDADIYAVQGYDAGLLLAQSLDQVDGNTQDHEQWFAAMRSATIDSPRGPWRFSSAQNPIQNIYLREVRNGSNQVISIAAEGLSDPAPGCPLH